MSEMGQRHRFGRPGPHVLPNCRYVPLANQNALPEYVEATTLALLQKSVMRLLFEAGPALSWLGPGRAVLWS